MKKLLDGVSGMGTHLVASLWEFRLGEELVVVDCSSTVVVMIEFALDFDLESDSTNLVTWSQGLSRAYETTLVERMIGVNEKGYYFVDSLEVCQAYLVDPDGLLGRD
jgi:hypothetical protein